MLLHFLPYLRGSQVVQQQRIRLPKPETKERKIRSLGWEDLLEEKMATHSSSLPGKSQGQRSLAGHSPRGRKGAHGWAHTQYSIPEKPWEVAITVQTLRPKLKFQSSECPAQDSSTSPQNVNSVLPKSVIFSLHVNANSKVLHLVLYRM